jgi:hypothetical protein
MLMRPKHSLDRLLTPKTSGHDLMGNSIDHLRKICLVTLGCGRAAQSRGDSFSNECLERIWAKLFDLS